MTTPRDQKRVEMQRLADRCHLTARFLAARDHIDLEPWARTIDGALGYNRIASMRMLAKELDTMASVVLTLSEREALDKQLQGELGVDVDGERQGEAKQIRKIIRRGRILNEDEYRLLRARVDVLQGEAGADEEVARLNRFLDRFDLAGEDTGSASPGS